MDSTPVALKRCTCGRYAARPQYGDRCEDCYVDGITGHRGSKRSVAELAGGIGRKVIKAEKARQSRKLVRSKAEKEKWDKL